MEDLRRGEVRELARLTARLNAAQQTFFQAEYGRHRRNPTTALLLCLLLGCFGAHYLYFGRLRAGVLRLLFFWTLVPLVTSLFEARTIASRAFRYNASLANELLLALENMVDEQFEPGLALAAAVQRATVTPAEERAAIAAPTAVASSPESELADAAWAGRKSASADRADPPLASDQPIVAAAMQTLAAISPDLAEHDAHAEEGTAAHEVPGAAGWAPYAHAGDPAYANANGNGNGASRYGRTTLRPYDKAEALSWPGADTMSADPTADEPFVRPTDSSEQAWHPGAEADSSWAREPIAHEREAERPWWMRDDEQDDEPEPLPWFLADARPAIAAADTDFPAEDTAVTEEAGETLVPSAPFASWPKAVNLRSLSEAETPATEPPVSDPTMHAAAGEREPVFTYETAPTTRRDAVRLGPPPLPEMYRGGHEGRGLGERTQNPSATSVSSAVNAEQHGDLRQGVREDFELAALGSALAAGLADLLRERPARPRSVPLSQPLPDSSPPAHQRDELLGDLLWASAALPPPEFTPAALAPSGDDVGGAAAPDPAQTLDDADADPLIDVPPSGADEVQTSLATAPAAAYVSRRSQGLRRRVVQRVIVRKMAVVEGRVVAESTVERQVPVVADDDEMAERVRVATADAAREALGNLMRQAPQEALPAIRLQLYALDSSAAVQNLRVSRG